MVDESELSAAERFDMAAARMAATSRPAANGHLLHDKGGKDAVRRMHGLRLRVLAIEDEQPSSDDEEKGELQQNHPTRRQQRHTRLAQVPCRKQPLHHQLVGAVRGHGKKRSTEHARPEGVGRRKIHRVIEHLQFARSGGHRMDRRPSATDLCIQCEQRHDRARDVEQHLYHVCPDHGGHAALEGVQHGKRGDERNAGNIVRANSKPHHDGDRKDAHAFRRRAR